MSVARVWEMKLEQNATDSPPIPHSAVCNGMVTRDEFLNAWCACGFVGWNRFFFTQCVVWCRMGKCCIEFRLQYLHILTCSYTSGIRTHRKNLRPKRQNIYLCQFLNISFGLIFPAIPLSRPSLWYQGFFILRPGATTSVRNWTGCGNQISTN